MERRAAERCGRRCFRPGVRPATREETFPFAIGAVVLGFIALLVCFSRGYILLYGDAVAHLGIARRIYDSRNPGLAQLGGVWLPLPHLLMLPFVQKMEWWQSGLAGAWPSLVCYILAVIGILSAGAADAGAAMGAGGDAFYGLNPNLLYLSTTAMTEPLFLALLIWLTLLTMECVSAIRAADARRGGAAAGADWVADPRGGVYALRRMGAGRGGVVRGDVAALAEARHVAAGGAVVCDLHAAGGCGAGGAGSGTTSTSSMIRWTLCAGLIRRGD